MRVRFSCGGAAHPYFLVARRGKREAHVSCLNGLALLEYNGASSPWRRRLYIVNAPALHPPCSKNGAAGGRPRRLATAARRWPVARDRSPAWFGTCSEGFLCAPVARAIFLPQDVHISLSIIIAVAKKNCSKNGAAGGRPRRLASAARSWPVARERSPA